MKCIYVHDPPAMQAATRVANKRVDRQMPSRDFLHSGITHSGVVD